MISEVFKGKREGYFVDAGAGPDGILNSNTYALETQFGWTGLLVEPHPDRYPKVVENRKSRVESVCLTDRPGEVEFTLNTLLPGTSGLVEEMSEPSRAADGWLDHDFPSIMVQGVPLWDLLERSNAPQTIDYMSLDIEGAEWLALRDFPFDRYRFRCMTIERGGKDYSKVAALLRRHGYRLAKVQGPDDFYFDIAGEYRPPRLARIKALARSAANNLYFREPALTIRRVARSLRSRLREPPA